MKFQELVEIVADEPLFDTGFLLAGSVARENVQQQLSRWKRTGHVNQLRRGLYTLGHPWQKVRPHRFLAANYLVPGTYVSGLSVLAYANVIPEYVPEVTSFGGGRPQTYQTGLGRFSFHYLKTNMRFGYRLTEVTSGQSAFVAEPEKALLDLLYIVPGSDNDAYLQELRLDFEALRIDRLASFAETSGVPKLKRAAKRIHQLSRESQAFQRL